MDWSFNSLWQKAKVYADRSLQQPRDSALFSFWSSLTLEFLARATLAKLSPALLADPRGDESMMYAFGFPAKNPKSVPMETVLKRCRVILSDSFTEELAESMRALVNLRNEELHTGKPAFEDYPTRLWLTAYYKTVKVMLAYMGKGLQDLLGQPEAKVAQQMIDAADEKLVKEVRKQINKAKGIFESLDAKTQKQKREEGAKETQWKQVSSSKVVECPACKAQALLEGDEAGESEPRLEGDEVVVEFVFLPRTFECSSCGLRIEGYGNLNAAEMGGQYTREVREDATEYYANRSEWDDWDAYGND
jgi:hypothetical protein